MPDRHALPSVAAIDVVIALLAVASFLALSTPRLSHPGPYDDELHQAAPA